MAWLYLIIAALFETAWTFSVKYFKFSSFRLLNTTNIYKAEGIYIVAPLLGYIIFGIANVYFFSLAIKQVPTAMAFAVWTASTLVFIKLVDVFFFRQHISWAETFFLMLIMIGIIGMRIYSVSPDK
ncbi:DMT family transporter [Mucilaginibacter terrae]|uniref:DMT family transporter n=1 Tax=Mucilaginibacter terrae TaxID=1955052 RepID=UPI00362A15F5